MNLSLTNPTRNEVLVAVAEAMDSAGFQPTDRVKTMYRREIEAGAAALVSIDLRRDGTVGFDAMVKVGVRVHQVAEIEASLKGTQQSDTATVSRYLGYLMPQQSANVMWPFTGETDLAAQASDLVRHIETYAVPYFTRSSTLEGLLEVLPQDGMFEVRTRVPIVLMLLDRPNAAREYLTGELAKATGDTPAERDYRTFGERYAEKFGASPTPDS